MLEHNLSVIGTIYIKLFSQKLLASHDKPDLREWVINQPSVSAVQWKKFFCPELSEARSKNNYHFFLRQLWECFFLLSLFCPREIGAGITWEVMNGLRYNVVAMTSTQSLLRQWEWGHLSRLSYTCPFPRTLPTEMRSMPYFHCSPPTSCPSPTGWRTVLWARKMWIYKYTCKKYTQRLVFAPRSY